MDDPWKLAACSGASIVFGILLVSAIVYFRKHKGVDGKTNAEALGSAFMSGANSYTLGVMLIGYFSFGIPISTSVNDYFTNGRTSWLFAAVLTQLLVRIYCLFDP